VYPGRLSASPKESEPEPVPERRSRPSRDPSPNDERPLDEAPSPPALSPVRHRMKKTKRNNNYFTEKGNYIKPRKLGEKMSTKRLIVKKNPFYFFMLSSSIECLSNQK
jgi:hypothetical protein